MTETQTEVDSPQLGPGSPPSASSAAVAAVMRANQKKDTRPEVELRRELHRRGRRFRKDFPVKMDAGRPVRVDIAFPRARLAVFVDGCFWHRCPAHGTSPRTNSSYWTPKLDRNVERDTQTTARLRDAGWAVVRVWEHLRPDAAADEVIAALEGLVPDEQ